MEQWQEGVLDVGGGQLEDVEVLANVAQVEELELLGHMVPCLITSEVQDREGFSLEKSDGVGDCAVVMDFERELELITLELSKLGLVFAIVSWIQLRFLFGGS